MIPSKRGTTVGKGLTPRGVGPPQGKDEKGKNEIKR